MPRFNRLHNPEKNVEMELFDPDTMLICPLSACFYIVPIINYINGVNCQNGLVTLKWRNKDHLKTKMAIMATMIVMNSCQLPYLFQLTNQRTYVR